MMDRTISVVDGQRLHGWLQKLDEALERDTVLDLHGGAAVLMLGMSERTTLDIDVLPTSQFTDVSLRRACESVGLLFEPLDAALLEREYLEVIPEQTLILPRAVDDHPYTTVFRGERLTVRTPPAADLAVGKLRRIEPDDLADIAFLTRHFTLTRSDLEEAFSRLPERLKHDPVVRDNMRYVLEDFFDET